MEFTLKLILFGFIATNYQLTVYSSIRFDEVEFYDPNKTLDESASDGFPCAHLGEKCEVTAQCCGVATCALPSWSETPVCLVPGYKHDEAFKKRFLALHSLQPEDIRYIRDSYNTSLYDFLLSDLTFSAPPLNDVNNPSSESIAENNTVYDNAVDVFGDLGGNGSIELTTHENMTVANQTVANHTVANQTVANQTVANQTVEDEKNSTTFFTSKIFESDLKYSTSDSNINFEGTNWTNTNFSTLNSTNSSPIGNFDFKNHFKFLLINNTLESDVAQIDLKDIYDQIINTNKFKNIVEHLREKMREINEIEKKLSTKENLTFPADNYKETSTDPLTIEKTKPTQKTSKWSIVKTFFLNKSENQNSSFNFTTKNHLEKIVDDIAPKPISTVRSQENIERKTAPQSNHPDNEGFKKLLDDVDKIEKILDSDKTIQKFYGSKVNDEDLFDIYNINLPLSSFEDVTERTGRKNHSLEGVLIDIGDTINSMILKNKDEEKSIPGDIEIKKTIQGSDVPLQNDNVLVITAEPDKVIIRNGTHFWDKIHLWKIHRNLSEEVENSFKKLFHWKEKSSITKKHGNAQIPLNEYFLINLNSKNTHETTTQRQTESAERNSEDQNYLSSSESEFSSVEELYNNSYVFMVHNVHFEKPAKQSNWKRVMNFFRRQKVTPSSLDNTQTAPTIPNDSGNTKSDNDPGVVEVAEPIRLPEYLMPQALDRRQGNETAWIFEESVDTEDETIEERKISNSSFFFFFK